MLTLPFKNAIFNDMSPDIYKYDNYRIYLRDLFEGRKKIDPLFSHRIFAKAAGISNPGFCIDVIAGRRKVSKAALEKIIKGFELNDREAEYLHILVNYNHAKSDPQKQVFYAGLVSRRTRSSFFRLGNSNARYYQDFRYSLVRNGIEAFVFDGRNWNGFSKFFEPAIPESLLKKIVRDLCEWGLVDQDAQGRYRAVNSLIEPPQTLGNLVFELNKEWIRQAFGAMQKVPAHKRHVSSMVFAVSRENYGIIKNKIEQFREDLFKIVAADKNPQCLAQLSLQYLPKSKMEDSRP